MKASLAYRELWQLAILNGVTGVVMIVAGVRLGDPPVPGSVFWAICLVAFSGLAYFRGRHMVRILASAPPPPADVTVHGVSTQVLAELGLVVAGIVAAVVAPYLLGLIGIFFVSAATGHVTEAAIVTGWERRHGGRLVRTGGWTDDERYFIAA